MIRGFVKNGSTIRVLCGVLIGILLAVTFETASAQTRYDLVVPGSTAGSVATVTRRDLEIRSSAGDVTVYQRDRQYDTADYQGYSNNTLRQVIRFPVSGMGNMQIGALNGALGVSFRPSRMQVKARMPVGRPGTGSGAGVIGLPGSRPSTGAGGSGISQTIYGIESALGSGVLLSARAVEGANLQVGTQQHDGRAVFFRLVPAQRDYYYLAAADNPNLVVGMAQTIPGKPGNAQLFDRRKGGDDYLQFKLVPANPTYVTLEIRANRNLVLEIENASFFRGTNVNVFDRQGLKSQQFRIIDLTPAAGGGTVGLPAILPGFTPTPAREVLISEEVVPNPPLPPAKVELYNSHKNELWVLVTDLRDVLNSRRVKIPAKKSQVVSFERDPGAKAVSVYEVRRADGTVFRDERVVDIPPEPLYDVSVYELAAQSVYIDRTRPGTPNEVSRSPKSVGFFVVPPQLTSGRSDVYQAARRRKNTGGVRRIDPKEWGLKDNSVPDAFEQLTRPGARS